MLPQETTPAPTNGRPLSPTVTTGEWLLTYLLAGIPVLGLVLLLGWAYNPRTPASKASWARATLLVLAVLGLLLCLAYWLLEFLSEYHRSMAD